MPHRIKFGAGCECCGGGCAFAEDSFNRPDNTDIGSDWTEVAGDAAIVSDALEFTTANALAIHNTDHPDGVGGEYYVVALVTVSQTGTVVRLVAHYSDTSNYYYAVATFGGTNAGTLSIGQVIGGVDEILETDPDTATLDAGTQYDFRLCYNNGVLRASIGSLSIVAVPDALSGVKAGVGTGGTVNGNARINEWSYQHIYNPDNPERENCLQCGTPSSCFGCQFQPLMLVTISGLDTSILAECSLCGGSFLCERWIPSLQGYFQDCATTEDFPIICHWTTDLIVADISFCGVGGSGFIIVNLLLDSSNGDVYLYVKVNSDRSGLLAGWLWKTLLGNLSSIDQCATLRGLLDAGVTVPWSCFNDQEFGSPIVSSDCDPANATVTVRTV